MRTFARLSVSALWLGALLTASARAQSLPWRQFVDDVTGEDCGLINAGNTELVILTNTGQFVIVSSNGQDVADVLLADTAVGADGSVITAFGPAGFIKFATDADGFASLFWVSLTGRVFDVDGFTGQPAETDKFPEEFANVLCDACPFWDDPSACVVVIDDDRDGVPDDGDDCLDTPIGEAVDAGGCSCSQLDDDGDTIDNCDDLCPDTPDVVNVVDADGCACFEIDSDGDGVDDCDDLCPTSQLGSLVDVDGCPIVVRPPPIVVQPPTVVIGVCGNFIGAPLMIMFLSLGLLRFARPRGLGM